MYMLLNLFKRLPVLFFSCVYQEIIAQRSMVTILVCVPDSLCGALPIPDIMALISYVFLVICKIWVFLGGI